jgi:hypothetical protein
MMGYGMMYGSQGMGPGMMGRGYGPNIMGPGYGMTDGRGHGMRGWHHNRADLNLNISMDDARKYFERMLAIQGNSRLKVGEVKEKDNDTLTVDIVTKDNALVERYLVSRRNGFYQPDEEG